MQYMKLCIPVYFVVYSQCNSEEDCHFLSADIINPPEGKVIDKDNGAGDMGENVELLTISFLMVDI